MYHKYTYEYVKEFIEELGYILIDEEYIDVFTNMTLKDNEEYFYYACVHNLQKKFKPKKFHKSNPHTVQNINLWCVKNNKPFKLVSNKYESCDKKLKWQCLKDECGEIFESDWNHIFKNRGCGYCHGFKAGISNCLATKNPELASEWNLNKNGNLTPYDVTCNSDKKVWWKCIDGHEWEAIIGNRNRSSQCPYCVGKLPSSSNNLLMNNPELCEEWDYNKNKNNPENFTSGSRKYAWWICKECNNEWRATINSRNSGSGCPRCANSKGEKYIASQLKNKNIYYIPQKIFNGLIGLGNGLLSYDFYLPTYNLLIEYQGQYHDGTASNQTKSQFKTQQEHDKRKKEYALNNNIKLLEIWYYDFDRIEEILKKELNTN